MNDDQLWLYSVCQKNGIIITDVQLQQLRKYQHLLREWNAKINLISRKDEENLWRNHIFQSLIFAFVTEFTAKMKILDLGTGGGLPGIPLAILYPDCSFVLIDSIQKKIVAVEAMKTDLGLTNVTAISGRAEEINKKEQLRRSFDVVVARAVSELTNLIKWGFPFLKGKKTPIKLEQRTKLTTPCLVTLKGGELEGEIQKTKRKYHKATLLTKQVVFPGSEGFENLDKKLVIATA